MSDENEIIPLAHMHGAGLRRLALIVLLVWTVIGGLVFLACYP